MTDRDGAIAPVTGHPRARSGGGGGERQSVPRRVRDLVFASVQAGDLNRLTPIVEDELIAQYQSTRNAVREALQQLASEGVLQRARRSGTRPKVSDFVSVDINEFTELATAGASVFQRVTEDRHIPVTALIRRLLELEESQSEVRMVENIFVANGQVIGVRCAYYSTAHTRFDYGDMATVESLSQFFGKQVGSIGTQMGACRVDEPTARLLGIESDQAAIYRQQLFVAVDGTPMQLVFDHFRADMVTFTSSYEFTEAPTVRSAIA